MLEKDIELPMYPETAELGEKGVRMIADAVEDQLHWIFRPNEKTERLQFSVSYRNDKLLVRIIYTCYFMVM